MLRRVWRPGNPLRRGRGPVLVLCAILWLSASAGSARTSGAAEPTDAAPIAPPEALGAGPETTSGPREPATSVHDDSARSLVSDERGRTYWSRVRRGAVVRALPDRRARRAGKLGRWTYSGLPDVVIVLKQSGHWSRVRYSGLGRRLGWVPTSALSSPRLTHAWVVVDRRRQVLRAYRGERQVLRVPVGVGAKGSPTPGGRFLVRERLVPVDKGGIYGVLAFGLSAYSRHRTDWPGGGQVGIHGTNQPQLIPGRISNGCIRMRNGDVLGLDRIAGPGTPVRVR
jgi:hypothetical protein